MVLGPEERLVDGRLRASSSSSAAAATPRPTPGPWPGCTSRRSASRSTRSSASKDLKIDDTTRAHLKEIRLRIDKVLEANLDANEP